MAKGGTTEPRSGPAALPCLLSNNSTEGGTVNRLTGGHKRMAEVLCQEIQWLAKDFGVERLGFLTLTFSDHVQDIREAQRRFNSLNSHVLRSRYQRAIGVWERQASGRIHFHLVVVMPGDIRTGFDFAGIAKRDYRSANAVLRAEWAFWRATAPKYRFGRTELLPVKSTAESIARYVGGYVKKHIGERREQDKGARTIRFLGFKPGERRWSGRFSWANENAWLWRQKLKQFAARSGVKDLDHLRAIFGHRWAHFLAPVIMAEKLEHVVYPSEACAQRSTVLQFEREAAEDRAEKVKNSNGGRDYVLRTPACDSATDVFKPREAYRAVRPQDYQPRCNQRDLNQVVALAGRLLNRKKPATLKSLRKVLPIEKDYGRVLL
jgi:hypothetical protein